jgi:hypothetical protein
MSTKLNDFPRRILLRVGLASRAYEDGALGASLDFGDGDGPCFAILQVTGITPGNPVDVNWQESHDAQAWIDGVGEQFPIVTSDEELHVISFERTRRFVRVQASFTANATLCVLVGQQRKQV